MISDDEIREKEIMGELEVNERLLSLKNSGYFTYYFS